MKSIRDLIDIVEDTPMDAAVKQQLDLGRQTKAPGAPQHPIEIGKTKYNQDFAQPGNYTPTMAEPEQDYPTAPTKYAPPPAELPQGAQAEPTQATADHISRASQLQPQAQAPAPVTAPTTPGATSGVKFGKQLTKDEIVNLQSILVNMGYNLGKTGSEKNGIDGVWGPATEKAFKTAYSQMYGQKLSESPSSLKEYITLVEAEGSTYHKWGQNIQNWAGDFATWIKQNALQPTYNVWGDMLSGVVGRTPGSDWTDTPTAQNNTAPQGNSATTTPTQASALATGTSQPSTAGFGPRGYLVSGGNTLALQKFINSRFKELGITGQDIAADGMFGPKTVTALNLLRSKETDPTAKQQLTTLGSNIKQDKPAGAGKAAPAQSGKGATTTPAEPQARPGYYFNKQGQEVPSNFDPTTGKVTGMPPPLKTQQGASTTPAAQQPNIHQQMRNLSKTDPDVAATRQAFRESVELEDILKLANLNKN